MVLAPARWASSRLQGVLPSGARTPCKRLVVTTVTVLIRQRSSQLCVMGGSLPLLREGPDWGGRGGDTLTLPSRDCCGN